MAGAPSPKAELIPYDSLFPADHARRAAERVLAEIPAHQSHLDRLRRFAADNAELINLVRALPDHLSHHVMVPFGKAAFFPGRLVHTNELLVFLGEGYYAEQTAKQAVRVLRRRSKGLEEKMDALSATIADLKSRAEFFGNTARESMEGIVEIREFEEPEKDKNDGTGPFDSGSLVSSKDIAKQTITNEEYSQILDRLDKLGSAELDAESMTSDDEDESAASGTYPNIDNNYQKNTVVQKPKSLESPQKELMQTSMGKGEATGVHLEPCLTGQSSIIHENPYLLSNNPSCQTIGRGSFDSKSECQEDTLPNAMGTNRSVPLAFTHKDNIEKEQVPKNKEPPTTEAFTTSYGHRKAFTGDIVEHVDGLDSKPTSQVTSSKPSRPVSRFKMQKGR